MKARPQRLGGRLRERSTRQSCACQRATCDDSFICHINQMFKFSNRTGEEVEVADDSVNDVGVREESMNRH